MPNDEQTPRLNWGGGFIRGYELASDRYSIAIRRELVLRGFPLRDIEIAIDYAYMSVNSTGPKRTEHD